MNIVIDEDQRLPDLLPGQMLPLMACAGELSLRHEGLAAGGYEVSLSFLPEEEIRKLNLDYRGEDSPTDVLSFPMYENVDDIKRANGNDMPFMLGDVVICYEIAEKQAAEIGQSPEEELIYLFVHSMFHLLGHGHDSEKEKQRMREAEKTVLGELHKTKKTGPEMGEAR